MKKDEFIFLVIVFLILSAFFIKCLFYLDPDFSWHLRMGQIISSSSIPQKDPFSYTMSSFPFIDHEWLTNVVFWRLYTFWGKLGLSLLYSLIAFSSLIILVANSLSRKPQKILKKLTPLLLGGSLILDYVGVRPQVQSWFLLSILLVLVLNEEIWLKYRFFYHF